MRVRAGKAEDGVGMTEASVQTSEDIRQRTVFREQMSEGRGLWLFLGESGAPLLGFVHHLAQHFAYFSIPLK